MKKKIIYFSLCFITCLLFAMGKTQSVQASTAYQSMKIYSDMSKQERTVGNTTFSRGTKNLETQLYASINGNKKLLLSACSMESEIVTNGKVVYCIASLSNEPYKLYRISVTGGVTGQYIIDDDSFYNLKGFYNNKVFYLNTKTLFSYDIQSGKKEVVSKNLKEARQYGKYIYLTGSPNDFTIKVYNVKTGKIKTICKTIPYYDIVSGNVYYIDCLSLKPDGGRTPGMGVYFVVSLKKCKLDGSGKKTLLKRLDVQTSMSIKITKNSITYYNSRDKKVKRKF